MNAQDDAEKKFWIDTMRIAESIDKLRKLYPGKKWNRPLVPRTAVQVIPIDSQGLILTQHRSEHNRSARNVWSWPTGMHELGETLEECAVRELQEELQLFALGLTHLGVYENIAGDPEPDAEQFHWVVHVFGVRVVDVGAYVNTEPKKHDKLELLACTVFRKPQFFNDFKYHQSFENWATANAEHIISKLRELIV